MSDAESYLFSAVVYAGISFSTPAIHRIPGLAQWCAYSVDGDCELQGWDERANEDRSFVDWWDAPWVRAAAKWQKRCDMCGELTAASDIDGSYPYGCCIDCYWSLPG